MTSLRARLGAGLVVSLLVMVGLLWLSVGLSARILLEQQLATRLSHDAESLLGGLQFNPEGQLLLDAARIQGIYQQPFSGHYYQVNSGEQAVRSRSLWDAVLPVPALAVGETRLSFVDATIVNVARNRADGLVATFDRELAAVPGISAVPN